MISRLIWNSRQDASEAEDDNIFINIKNNCLEGQLKWRLMGYNDGDSSLLTMYCLF